MAGWAAAASVWLGLATHPAHAGDITFWTWRQEDKAVYTALFQEFTQQNPDIHVAFQAYPPETYNTVLSTALAGGKGGDVLHVRAYGGLETIAKAGYLLPLDTGNVPELANVPQDAKRAESVRADGRVYAMPFASQTLGLFVNQDAFDRAGVTPPATWDELLAAGQALRAKGVIPIANGMATSWMDEVFACIFTAPYLGAGFVDDITAGRATFADPRFTTALGKLLQLRDDLPPNFMGVDYATAQQLFLSGRAAMFAGGSFEIANFRRQNPKLRMQFLAPPAATQAGARPVPKFYDGGYAVNARSADQADALKLVRWMGTKHFGDELANKLGNISPIQGVAISDPMLAGVQALNATSMPYVMAVNFRYDTPTGSELLQNGMQRMMAGNATPEQVGADITQGIARYYKPFQK